MEPGTRITKRSRGGFPGGGQQVRPEAITVAFELLYRAFFVRLVRRATWKFHLSKEDASEVVQDAFIVALDKLDINDDPTAWLYRTVDNLALNWRRKIDRRARLTTEWGPCAMRQEEEGGGES